MALTPIAWRHSFPITGEAILNGVAHEFDETVFFLALAHLFFKLRSEPVKQLDIAGHKWRRGIGGAEEDRVP